MRNFLPAKSLDSEVPFLGRMGGCETYVEEASRAQAAQRIAVIKVEEANI